MANHIQTDGSLSSMDLNDRTLDLDESFVCSLRNFHDGTLEKASYTNLITSGVVQLFLTRSLDPEDLGYGLIYHHVLLRSSQVPQVITTSDSVYILLCGPCSQATMSSPERRMSAQRPTAFL